MLWLKKLEVGKLGMLLEVNIMIVIKGKEKWIFDNFFELEKLGYWIYLIDVLIVVCKIKEGEIFGEVIFWKFVWENNKIIIKYELIVLNLSN